MKRSMKGAVLLTVTACIWGVAFVAQTTGGAAVGAFTYNAVRSALGALVLVPVLLVMRRGGAARSDRRTLAVGGALCGVALFAASSLQQLGINAGTDAGKAGFITAMYIVIVPLFGLFFRRRIGWHVWVCVAVAAVGLYLLCGGGFTFAHGDLLILGAAVLFAVHILLADYFSPRVNGVALSAIQFAVCAVLSAVCIPLGGETPTVASLTAAWLPIVYGGVLSSGVAYTLQIVGQKYIAPTVGALIMSLESVFAVLAGALLLAQIPTPREWVGCALMFVAILGAQIPKRTHKTGESTR